MTSRFDHVLTHQRCIGSAAGRHRPSISRIALGTLRATTTAAVVRVALLAGAGQIDTLEREVALRQAEQEQQARRMRRAMPSSRPRWRKAWVASRISLRLAAAEAPLAALIEEAAETFDFAFIDADKESYGAYYEAVLALLRPGGLMALDNMLPDGVWDEAARGPMARAVHPVNLRIRDDARVDASPATIGAGMMLVRKR